MARESRKAKIFVRAILFVLMATTFAFGISSLETKGVAFTSCRVSGCRTSLAITVGSGIFAILSLLALVGACLARDDDSTHG
jgi:hypothetical protein